MVEVHTPRLRRSLSRKRPSKATVQAQEPPTLLNRRSLRIPCASVKVFAVEGYGAELIRRVLHSLGWQEREASATPGHPPQLLWNGSTSGRKLFKDEVIQPWQILNHFPKSGAASQFLPPGTTDVPIQRPGDCNQVGPATYVYRMSKVEPNDYFPKICSKMGGASVRFNNPCAWAHGQAQMTAAHFTNMCKGATRMIHWHTQADEWGFVSKGRLMTFVASPDGLPWPSSTNVLSPRGVWYFPSNWLHGLLCLTPEEEGGCEFTIIFASPQAAEPNGHNLDTTFAQADDDVAAQALDLSLATYEASRPAFGRAKHSIHYSNRNMTAPIVTAVLGGECDPECPPIQETVGAPAAVQSFVEQKVLLPHTEGVTLYRIKTDQFPFSRTMSQERTELAPGAVRPLVWTTADSILMVVSGTVTVSLEGGILGNESHLEFAHETLEKGDVAYFPNGRAYWFREATGKHPAETINVFNVGIWKSIELRQAVSEMPRLVVMSNLHQAEFARPKMF